MTSPRRRRIKARRLRRDQFIRAIGGPQRVPDLANAGFLRCAYDGQHFEEIAPPLTEEQTRLLMRSMRGAQVKTTGDGPFTHTVTLF